MIVVIFYFANLSRKKSKFNEEKHRKAHLDEEIYKAEDEKLAILAKHIGLKKLERKRKLKANAQKEAAKMQQQAQNPVMWNGQYPVNQVEIPVIIDAGMVPPQNQNPGVYQYTPEVCGCQEPNNIMYAQQPQVEYHPVIDQPHPADVFVTPVIGYPPVSVVEQQYQPQQYMIGQQCQAQPSVAEQQHRAQQYVQESPLMSGNYQHVQANLDSADIYFSPATKKEDLPKCPPPEVKEGYVAVPMVMTTKKSFKKKKKTK